MAVQGFACLIWNGGDDWWSLCCSEDRAKVEGLAERLREMAFLVTRVVACDLGDDDVIYVSGARCFAPPVMAEIRPEIRHPDGTANE